MASRVVMNEAPALTQGSGQLVSDSGAVVWARPDLLRRSLRSGAKPSPDPRGDGPHLPEDRHQWKERLVSSVKAHMLLYYIAAVSSVTLLVLLLQLFAGVHA